MLFCRLALELLLRGDALKDNVPASTVIWINLRSLLTCLIAKVLYRKSMSLELLKKKILR